MGVFKIVLTGGPCGGKSTGLSRIEQELTERGYKVYVVAETATELILGGIKPTEIPLIDFQKAVFDVQREKERAYLEQAKKYSENNNVTCIILLDRGLLDSKAFLSEEDFKELIKIEKVKEVEVKDNYDGIFHLVTAANGAESFYTLANNSARQEGTIEEAIRVDNRLIQAWTGHPHLRVIDNSTGFNEKIDRLMSEIYSLLGEPIPTEIERKYLIKKPNIENLYNFFAITKLNIIQTYLKSDNKVERRVRQRGIDGVYSYYYTEKIGEGISRVEKERKLTENEYLKFLMEADTSLHQIRKDRYCFVFKNNYFELDIYPFWEDYAILEVELTSENQKVELPEGLEVIKEVTDDKNYKNKSLAKSSNFTVL